MVERHEKRATFLKGTHAIEAHGIEPLKDVLIFAMLGRAPVLFNEALDFLKPGDDAFLTGGAPPVWPAGSG